MDFGEFMGLAAMVIGTVSIVGILTGAYKAKLQVRAKELELRILQASGRPAQADRPDPQVEQRLRVLERIATDKGPDLAAKIEELRDARQKEVM